MAWNHSVTSTVTPRLCWGCGRDLCVWVMQLAQTSGRLTSEDPAILKQLSFSSSLTHTFISSAVSIQTISGYSMSHPSCSLPPDPAVKPPPQPPPAGRWTHTPKPFFPLSGQTNDPVSPRAAFYCRLFHLFSTNSLISPYVPDCVPISSQTNSDYNPLKTLQTTVTDDLLFDASDITWKRHDWKR